MRKMFLFEWTKYHRASSHFYKKKCCYLNGQNIIKLAIFTTLDINPNTLSIDILFSDILSAEILPLTHQTSLRFDFG